MHIQAAATVGVSLLSFVQLGLAKLYTDPSQLKKTTYDFVVVGGRGCLLSLCEIPTRFSSPAGTAGNVIAARLTENPRFSVLVIEAGVTYVSPLLSWPVTRVIHGASVIATRASSTPLFHSSPLNYRRTPPSHGTILQRTKQD